jgi:hypothetical protein
MRTLHYVPLCPRQVTRILEKRAMAIKRGQTSPPAQRSLLRATGRDYVEISNTAHEAARSVLELIWDKVLAGDGSLPLRIGPKPSGVNERTHSVRVRSQQVRRQRTMVR